MIRVVEAEPARCIDLLLAGDGDLAVLVVDDSVPPETDERFEQHTVLDDPIDLAVPVGHHLTTRPEVTLRDAASESWITCPPGSAYHRLTLAACQAAGFRPTVAHQAEEWDTGTALVAHGFGIFMLPRLAPVHPGTDVVRLRLSGTAAPVRRLVAVTRAGGAAQPVIAHALASITRAAGSISVSTAPSPAAGARSSSGVAADDRAGMDHARPAFDPSSNDRARPTRAGDRDDQGGRAAHRAGAEGPDGRGAAHRGRGRRGHRR